MNILLMYGAKSCEHDISIITAMQMLPILQTKYKVTSIYVDNDGQWRLSKLSDSQQHKKLYKKMPKAVILPNDNCVYIKCGRVLKKIAAIDVAVLCFHGVNGEDGSVAGYLQLCNIPYCSSPMLASSVFMDKIASKYMFEGLKLNTLKSCYITQNDYNADANKQLKRACELDFPLIVKPSNLGSSIGITVARDMQQLAAALDVAFNFDSRVLVEVALTDFFEINCAAYMRNGNVVVGNLERPYARDQILSFADKYLSSAKSGGMKSLKRQCPYDTPYAEEIKSAVTTIYKSLNCNGIIRCDFIVDNIEGKCYINEVNSIPGSLAYYLFDTELLRLLEHQMINSVDIFKRQEKLTFRYNSVVLDGAKVGKK